MISYESKYNKKKFAKKDLEWGEKIRRNQIQQQNFISFQMKCYHMYPTPQMTRSKSNDF
jgi:hypothetical protein